MQDNTILSTASVSAARVNLAIPSVAMFTPTSIVRIRSTTPAMLANFLASGQLGGNHYIATAAVDVVRS